jgi:metal-responsive CopG/Arc/MetJ family transcriptional regulator
MKTIAIAIEEDVVKRIDRITGRDRPYGNNRSHFIREAVRQFLERIERETEEQGERVMSTIRSTSS